MLIAGTKPGDRWYRERLLLKKGLSVIQKRSFSQVAYYKKVSTTPIAPIFRDFQAKKELEVAKGT